VAPLIDGRRDEQEILLALQGKASELDVYYTLTTLEQKGYLTEAAPPRAPEAQAFWSSLGVEVERAAERLAATPVAVLSVGDADASPLAEALAGVGVTMRADAALRAVVASDFLDPELASLNLRALEERFRWLIVKPAGTTPWVGPMFRPGEGPCWECLAARLRHNRPVETFIARRMGQSEPITPPRALLPTSARAALDFAALALGRWIVDGCQGPIDHKLFSLNLARFSIEEHAVVRRPQCPACGDSDLLKRRAEAPLMLAPRPKRFTDDGGYRVMTPEETFARHAHLISPITGVVTSLGPMPGRDHPLRPVYGAAYFTCPLPDGAPGFDEFSRPSLGKGRTPAQARAGALCEAIERYSAICQGDEPLIRARLAELGDEAVDPRALLHFSASQYQRREEHNRAMPDPRRRIPLPFDEQIAIDWAPAWSLTEPGRRRYLPAAYCYLHLPVPREERFSNLDPNGHAAGNCLEEAILQALFELAERDAVGIWWYNRLCRPAVDLASFGQPYFLALEDHYRSLGYELWVLDVTSDLELPAFVAVAHAAETGRYGIGFGCHLEARLGVQRALTELNQIYNPASPSLAPWGDHALADSAYLFPNETLPPRRKGEYAQTSREDLRDDVLACVERAARLGLQVLVVDQTRPDIGLCAVKVVVPGLRHMWPRLGPGRLYEVPVRMGWLERPRTEEELNPVPLYL
jgi:ribosomal protein S12 methylthiotransferase accessory factor